jgi:peptidoglycan/LPS O-acetylase OafA/YrhL
VFGPEIRFLKGHVFQELGSASYSIYILHWVIFIGFLLQPHHRPATFFTSLLVGMGFYYTFEKPFLSFVRKKLRAHASTREMASRDLSETSELPGTAVP